MHTLLAREPGHRNRVLLRLLYRAGLRVSEIAGLCWRDLHARDDGGQVTVFGKGGKTRTVRTIVAGEQQPLVRRAKIPARKEGR